MNYLNFGLNHFASFKSARVLTVIIIIVIIIIIIIIIIIT